MSVPAIILTAFLTLPSTVANTYASPVTLRATIEPVLQVNLDSDLVSLDLSPINSTTAFDNEDLNVTVVTNNQAGYDLSLTASSTNLTRTTALADNTTPTIPTLTTTASADNFPANRWGYRTDSTANYSPFATTINFPSVTTPTDGTSTTVNFAAKIDDTQPAGTYELALVFTATARPTTQDFIINFDSGVSSVAVKTGSATGTTVGTVATTGGTVAGLANGATYYLVPTFAEGYEFSSWTNDSGSVGTLGTADANGIVTYTVGDQVDAGDINSVTLATEDVRPAMQNLADDMCVTSEPTLVKDTRDGKTYTVQRLADGKCWMTSNLNLAGGTKLDSEGSNVPAGYTQANPYYTLPASETISSGTSLNNRTDETKPFSSDTVDYVFNSSNNTTDCTSSKPCNSYYSWLAATAGGKDASGSAVTGNGYNTAYSICPKGWRLPTATTEGVSRDNGGYTGGDFYRMILGYMNGATSLNRGYYDNTDPNPFYTNAGPGTTPNFLLAGRYISGSFLNGGSSGFYWPATSYSSTNGYTLYFYSGSVYSADTNARRYGFSVRCVKQTDTERELGIRTMQDFGNLSSTDKTNLINKMEPEKAYYVTDSRDNEGYNIAKLADGKVWLLDNLRLGSTSSMTLRNTDTNITASTYTLPASISSGFESYGAAQINTASKTTNATYSSNITSSSFNANDTAKIGVYYNYCAATAGGICSSSNSSSASADRDICPKGWRMPTGGSSGEYQALYTAYSSNYQNFQAALRTPLSGYFLNSSANDQGSNGFFWSAKRNDNARMYSLYVDASSVSPQNYSTRHNGFSVRCVLK